MAGGGTATISSYRGYHVSSAMENAEYSRLLEETADLMEIAGEDGFRIEGGASPPGDTP